nr:fimbrial protein [Bacteroides coprosuis]
MKFKKLLLVALAAIGFTSCSNDDDLQEVNNEGNAWTSFSIALPSAKTTRADKGETEEGTSDEQAVEGVRVVLYNNNLVAYAFDLEIKTDGETSFNGKDVLEKATKSVFETKAQKVKKTRLPGSCYFKSSSRYYRGYNSW